MSLRPARQVRPFTNYQPKPYETEPLPDEPPPALAGRVLDSRPCEKCRYDLLGQPLDGACPECGTAISRPTHAPIHQPKKVKIQRGVVGVDKRCTACGYNLLGLAVKGVCPECGQPIITSVRPAKYGHSMVDAPESWLRTFSAACVMTSMGGLGLLGAVITWAINGGAVAGPLMCMAGLVWWAGVVLITRPRPILPGVEIDTVREWMWWRLGARVSQACWVAGGAEIIASDAGTLSGARLESLAILTAMVAGLGMGATFVYISNLANWAGDDTALERTRAAIVLGPLAVLFGAVSMLNGWSGFIVPGPQALWGLGIYTVFIILPLVHLGRTFLAISQLGPWALANHRHERARQERLRAKAEAEKALADAAREHGVYNDTSQPGTALMPGPAAGVGRVPATSRGDSIRPGNRRTPPKLGL